MSFATFRLADNLFLIMENSSLSTKDFVELGKEPIT